MTNPISKSVGAIILNNKKEVLLLFQLKNSYWEFPKGKIDPGEEEREAFVREMREETGIIHFSYVPGFREEVTFSFRFGGQIIDRHVAYYCILTDDPVRLSPEHTRFQWVTVEEADGMLRHENARILLRKAIEAAGRAEHQEV
ncbi:MAG: NUDIX domain-containing protein [Patescibacteria group bacterium]|jgi:tRNA nucleotidyltransferase (CCA-adding enzyme)